MAKAGITLGGSDAETSDVKSPRTFFSRIPVRKTGVMPTVSLDPLLDEYPMGYHAGAASLHAIESDLISGNIKAGIAIFGITGTAMLLSIIAAQTELSSAGYTTEVSRLIMIPEVSDSEAMDSSGGGFTSNPSLSVVAPSVSAVAVLV